MQRPSRMRPYDADVMRTTEPGRQLALNDSCRQKSARDDAITHTCQQCCVLLKLQIMFKYYAKLLFNQLFYGYITGPILNIKTAIRLLTIC